MTLLLARLFESAAGVDADAEMLKQARLAAARAGVTNVDWHHMRAEDLPGGLGTFRVVTFAQSFHWFDQPRVARLVRQMLEPDGFWVHVSGNTDRGVPGNDSLPHRRPPYEEIAGLVTRYLGAIRRAGQGSLPDGTPAGEEDVMCAAGYRGPLRIEVGGGTIVERTADEVTASVLSLSSSAPHLFGTRLSEFEGELRDLLRDASPSGRFAERTREVMLVIWRP